MKAMSYLAIALILGLPACHLTGAETQVEVVNDPPDIAITNHGHRTIYYFAIDQNSLAFVLWGPCTDPDTCDRVRPGERVEIPHQSFSPDAEVIAVHWWHLVPRQGGGFQPDSIRHEKVRV